MFACAKLSIWIITMLAIFFSFLGTDDSMTKKGSQIHWLDESPIAYCYIFIAKSNYIPPLHKEEKVRQNRIWQRHRRTAHTALVTVKNSSFETLDCSPVLWRCRRLSAKLLCFCCCCWRNKNTQSASKHQNHNNSTKLVSKAACVARNERCQKQSDYNPSLEIF